jgi:S-adenosylmethionine synthetase
MKKTFSTAESVTVAHPDKVCDQISDAILDACLTGDRDARVAIEVMGGHGLITITGEITTKADIDIGQVADATYKACGYNEDIRIVTNVVAQSHEIKVGVDTSGAGDQGIMVGYATRETSEMLPLEVILSRRLTRAMGLRDGKAQVTLNEGRVSTIVTSVCASSTETDSVLAQVVDEIIFEYGSDDTTWLRNPNGTWTIGGFEADTGLTGRKLAIDNYGPYVPVGGGCFSGKDATKVDRSAAYMARHLAVTYLHHYNAQEAYVHLAYAIGVATPVMATVTLDGVTQPITHIDLSPPAIIEYLNLRHPQYTETAKYGHFGNGYRWDDVGLL